MPYVTEFLVVLACTLHPQILLPGGGEGGEDVKHPPSTLVLCCLKRLSVPPGQMDRQLRGRGGGPARVPLLVCAYVINPRTDGGLGQPSHRLRGRMTAPPPGDLEN